MIARSGWRDAQPRITLGAMTDYQRIEKAIHYIEQHFREQPSLGAMARSVHLSPFHFQRLFTRWAGISPKRFQQYLTATYAKERLRASRSVLDTAWDAGLSGPSRLHDLMVRVEAMSPGEFKIQGQGMIIEYGIHPSPFGDCLVALSSRGLCGLSFFTGKSAASTVAELQAQWPRARLKRAHHPTLAAAEKIFRAGKGDLKVLLRGTEFQIKVWEALLTIPPGHLISYSGLAEHVGVPGAARAVGSAVAANIIAYLVPCHRVIRSSGVVGEYRWGAVRKKALIAREAALALPLKF